MESKVPTDAPKSSPRQWPGRAKKAGVALALLYGLLLIPSAAPPKPQAAGETPFAWNRHRFWAELHQGFRTARLRECRQLAEPIDAELLQSHDLLQTLEREALPPQAPVFDRLETNLFRLAPLIAACPERIPQFMTAIARMRTLVKQHSHDWDVNSGEAQARLYRLLYGGRAALEEVLLQSPPDSYPVITPGRDEPSQTPAARLHGVAIHSGDILVSRGCSPNSALIARGNDFPGNFSHVALVHVDEASGDVSLIEAHIESGVGVASLEEYLRAPKSRVLILRPRSDLPQLAANPSLPHQAAIAALKRARAGHIPYDFSLDYQDHSRLFCSEVASQAYGEVGLTLWSGLSHLSGHGVTTWLSAFGAREFRTQKPTDLEYDPQLRVVAEWRDPRRLREDHLDNAVIDIMLEQADAGRELDYNPLLLPFARLAKAFSVIMETVGLTGPIPEGMSATTALRNQRFTSRHGSIKARTEELIGQFQSREGYPPPYSELLNLARTALGKGI